MTNLRNEDAHKLYYQTYTPQPAIESVLSIPLKKHRSIDGNFMEYMRITDAYLEGLPIQFEPRQISISYAVPKRINAFHIHPKTVQDEIWCVVAGCMRVWLVDVRKDSATSGVRSQFFLNQEEPSLLYIPTGVAHGYQAGTDGATLVYAMNSQFNREDPNEGRLPWDHFGADLWADDRG